MSFGGKGVEGGSSSGGQKAGKAPISVTAKLREQVALDVTIQNDPKYKKYAQQVEKCLATFENMHEWPDFIAFLKQLLKTVQSYTQFKEIPRKLIVSKRLSQCLIPALPSGVHQRALDVYSQILEILGPDGLKRDLPLWSSGLFPFFEYASTSVKPTLLTIFEKYYLPLQGELRPVMRAFILALLPGLEEETGEFFEKVMNLLDRLSGTVSPAFFLQNVWLVMLTTQVPRQYCLNYLSRRLPSLDANEDITPIVGRDMGLMIRAFSAALSDDNLLVQRSALDLLLQSLRIESAAVRQASSSDRAILMHAATGVVLRRDLSLNRRLFTWLLGSDEQSEKQTEYFRANALKLLEETLKAEMQSPSSDYAVTRPFKIYVSLLDKWEIGAPLTEVLIYDALASLRTSIQSSSDKGEDILITASTLFEAVEPRAAWRQLFRAVRQEILSTETTQKCIDLFVFVLQTFRVDEEEVQGIHLPLIFCALVEKLEEISGRNSRRIATSSFRAAMNLLGELAAHIPISSMTTALQLADIAFGGSFDDAACAFYNISTDSGAPTESPGIEHEKRWSSAVPFIASFEHLAELVLSSFEHLKDDARTTSQVFVQGLSLLLRLVNALNGTPPTSGSLKITWEADLWLDSALQSLEHPSSFAVLDSVISLAIALHATHVIEPTPTVNNRSRLAAMMKALLRYLRPEASPYHVRAVKLIWDLEYASTHRHLESILSQSLISSAATKDYDAHVAFGVLWRLSEDTQQPGIRFHIPMLAVLDMLKSEDPAQRRVGETWMRCNLRSYQRILDPILSELLSPNIRRTSITTRIMGRDISGLAYDKPFDQRRIAYLLDILLHVVRFGGHNFGRAVVSTHVSRSFSPLFVERVSHNGFSLSDSTYSVVLVDILLRFLQAEPKAHLALLMQRSNTEIQSLVIDLLQSVVSRGDLDQLTVETLESSVVSKLYALVHSQRLELQNKLLHLLHSVISSAASIEKQKVRSSDMTVQNSTESTADATLGLPHIEQPRGPPANPLLIQLLVDGIAVSPNRPLLHHWLDFVLMTVPQYPHILTSAITPLSSCICRQIRSALGDLSFVASMSNEMGQEAVSCADDAEFIMLLNALERLILINLDETDPGLTDETSPTDKQTSDGAGLLSMVSNVFLTDSVTQTSENIMTPRSPAYRSLHEGTGVLYSAWKIASQEPLRSHPAYDTLSLLYTRILSRCRKVLEKLFRSHAFEVIESIIDFWNFDQARKESGRAAFDIVDFLTSSSQNVVHMVCESISWRISPSNERSRKQVLNPELSDVILFSFLERYLAKLENPLALQVWPRYLSLARDIAANVKESRSQVFPVLRCMTVLTSKLVQTTAGEDRRVRKDIQDTYGKLLEACVMISGRAMDQSLWPRRTRDVNGRDSPVPRVQSDINLNEKTSHSAVLSPENTQKQLRMDLIDEINIYLADEVLPNLRRFLGENDKVAAVCTNVVYYIINPTLKARTGRLAEIDDIFIRMLEQMSRIPAAVKAWRNPVTDVFNDTKFFSIAPSTGLKWRSIVRTLIDSDKTALGELLGKITSAPSANIFTNREYEMQTKAQNLRRLSFVLFGSEKNHFLTQLPAIQEKMVDIMRSGNSPLVESEAYLCLRVLLCRLSPHNLSSFWPVLLAELIRIFEQMMAEPPLDGSDNLQAILSACKLVDLLLVLQTEEFQIHQWIFITDTVDAVYRPDNWFPEALVDQFSEVVDNLPATDSRRPSIISLPDATTGQGLRQPLLKSVKQIDSIHDLGPFFSHLSMLSYEGVYASGGAVDWEVVEQSLMEDIFDGRRCVVLPNLD